MRKNFVYRDINMKVCPRQHIHQLSKLLTQKMWREFIQPSLGKDTESVNAAVALAVAAGSYFCEPLFPITLQYFRQIENVFNMLYNFFSSTSLLFIKYK